MGSLRSIALATAVPLLLGACARIVGMSPPALPVVGAEESGRASWYGHPYHGRLTASGEVYDMLDLTAAHRTLPLGTRLMVTSVESGRAVEVRVNDRGPFVEGRVLDLSYGAASLLGAEGRGVIPVRLRVMSLPGSSPPTGSAAPTLVSGAAFSVQLGAFVSRARAEGLRSVLAREGSAATVSEALVNGETFYRVRVGPYSGRPAAQVAAEQLAGRGYSSVVVADR